MRAVIVLACCLALSAVLVAASGGQPNTCNMKTCTTGFGADSCGDGFCCNAGGNKCINPPKTLPYNAVCNASLACTAVCSNGGCNFEGDNDPTTCEEVFDAGSQGCACSPDGGNANCDSGVCYQGKCVEDTELGFGEPCFINEQCLSNSCDQTSYTCTATIGGPGDTCNIYTPCEEGYFCQVVSGRRRLLSEELSPREDSTDRAANLLEMAKDSLPGFTPRHKTTHRASSFGRRVRMRGGDDPQAGNCVQKTTLGQDCSGNDVAVAFSGSILGVCLVPPPQTDYSPCPVGSYCNGASCIAYPAQGADCDSFGSCAPGDVCNDGTCVAACSVPDGFLCTDPGACQHTCVTPANSESQTGVCGNFSTLVNNIISTINTVAPGGGCATSVQCTGTSDCVNGVCVNSLNHLCGPANHTIDCGLGSCTCGTGSSGNDYYCTSGTSSANLVLGQCYSGFYNYIIAYTEWTATASPMQQGQLSLGFGAAFSILPEVAVRAAIDFFCCASCNNLTSGLFVGATGAVDQGYTINCAQRTLTYTARCSQNTVGTLTCPSGGGYTPFSTSGIVGTTQGTAGPTTASTATATATQTSSSASTTDGTTTVTTATTTQTATGNTQGSTTQGTTTMSTQGTDNTGASGTVGSASATAPSTAAQNATTTSAATAAGASLAVVIAFASLALLMALE